MTRPRRDLSYTRVPLGWQDQAACQGTPLDWWFQNDDEDRRKVADYHQAATCCRTCPVVQQCGTWATTHLPEGFAAGLTPAQRRRKHWKENR